MTGLKQFKLKILIVSAIVILSFLLFRSAHRALDSSAVVRTSHLSYHTAQITAIISDYSFLPELDDPHFYGNPQNVVLGTVIYEIKVLRGIFAGELMEAQYHLYSPAHTLFQVGDRISVRIFELEGEISIVEIRTPERMETVFVLISLFLIFLCLIGGRRGLCAVLGLVFGIFAILFILIPLVILGYSPLPITFIVLTLITVLSMTLLAGVGAKGIAAILGTLSGVALTLLLAFFSGQALRINGYHMANASAIMFSSTNIHVQGLFISSILISAIGAIMDATMSVASALEEIYLANPEIKRRALFKAGFNISRDIIGTMSSTLIFAFIGGSLTLVIFIFITNTSFNQFINNDFIVMEIIKGITGSFGIILATPITALISASLLTGNFSNKRQ